MYQVGLSSDGKELCDNLFSAYRENGIKAIEISPARDDFDSVPYRDIKKWGEKYGVKLWSFHLPFSPFDKWNISDKTLSNATVTYFKELIKKATDIGIDKFVIHGGGEPINSDERSKRMEIAKDSLFRLAEFAGKYNAVIAVENLPRTCLGRNSTEINELTSAHPALRVCYDTNHLLSGENAVDFIKNVGNKIITTHISDYDFVNERHWLPGEGKLDFASILQALKEVEYKGVWMYEIGFKCPKTIYRNRDLTCADFARNAKELFAGEKPTVFSMPKPDLGYWE